MKKTFRIDFIILIILLQFLQSKANDTHSVKKNDADTIINDSTFIPINPLRGFYAWYTLNVVPQRETPDEIYVRYSWAQLEKSEGQYDFGIIDKYLNALPRGKRFAFGVFALNSCCSTLNGVDVPNYIVNKNDKGFYVNVQNKRVFVPDWNDDYFLGRVEKLFQALGKKYDGDPRIAWVDIRIYGDFGEWHVASVANSYRNFNINKLRAVPGITISKQRIIAAQINAFPHTRMLMMSDDPDALVYALNYKTLIPVGIRRDSWGSLHFEDIGSNTTPQNAALINNRWKIAPFIVETYGTSKAFEAGDAGIVMQIKQHHISAVGNGGFGQYNRLAPDQLQALNKAAANAGYNLQIISTNYKKIFYRNQSFRLKTIWRNIGSAPVYEKWIIKIELVKAINSAVTPSWAGNSTLDLSTIMPDEKITQTDTFAISQSIPAGTYFLAVQIVDPKGYLQPMELSIKNKLSNNEYVIGRVNVR